MTAEENLRFFARLFGIKNLDVAALVKRVGLTGAGVTGWKATPRA
jgi:ABC-type multidrug transport system ATPase subunit